MSSSFYKTILSPRIVLVTFPFSFALRNTWFLPGVPTMWTMWYDRLHDRTSQCIHHFTTLVHMSIHFPPSFAVFSSICISNDWSTPLSNKFGWYSYWTFFPGNSHPQNIRWVLHSIHPSPSCIGSSLSAQTKICTWDTLVWSSLILWSIVNILFFFRKYHGKELHL